MKFVLPALRRWLLLDALAAGVVAGLVSGNVHQSRLGGVDDVLAMRDITSAHLLLADILVGLDFGLSKMVGILGLASAAVVALTVDPPAYLGVSCIGPHMVRLDS